LRSRNFLVPGLIAIIMTLIGALLTALVMAREWERGTMEALLVTPVTMAEVLLGKVLPYFALGTGGMALSVAMGGWLFGVPLRGSLVPRLKTSRGYAPLCALLRTNFSVLELNPAFVKAIQHLLRVTTCDCRSPEYGKTPEHLLLPTRLQCPNSYRRSQARTDSEPNVG
jgi:ABC-type Na+ efflux pump permease subunit